MQANKYYIDNLKNTAILNINDEIKELKMKKLLLTIITLMALGACSKEDTNITGKTFALMPEKNFTIIFEEKENRFAGQAVNNYFGEYKLENNNITLTLIGSTMMAGPVEEMEKETKYFQDLGKITSYSYTNKTLTLTGKDITLTYTQQ